MYYNLMAKGQGSSPRMWGQGIGYIFGYAQGRIIPTRVGTRTRSVRPCVPQWDHPHACGDKISYTVFMTFSAGSSPRVWGQEKHRNTHCVTRSIIPTRVGTSKSEHSDPKVIWDHPHACGDKQVDFLNDAFKEGSSPRVWGQDKWLKNRMSKLRIIPTRVGTSFTSEYLIKQLQDHPHACGDRTTKTLSASKTTGSSPRVWGQDSNYIGNNSNRRIIPTRVGTSELDCLTTPEAADHPHACGDKLEDDPPV